MHSVIYEVPITERGPNHNDQSNMLMPRIHDNMLGPLCDAALDGVADDAADLVEDAPRLYVSDSKSENSRDTGAAFHAPG